MSYFQRYFENRRGPLPKFIGIFTEDQILSGFLEGLGWPRHYGIDPASGLFIEFFKDSDKDNQIFVRTYFNTLTESLPVKVNKLESNVISLSDFLLAMYERLDIIDLLDDKTACVLAEYPTDYFSPDTVINELNQYYGLNDDDND